MQRKNETAVDSDVSREVIIANQFRVFSFVCTTNDSFHIYKVPVDEEQTVSEDNENNHDANDEQVGYDESAR